MLRPAMMAINELKLPMLKHSRATSIQYSITLTRCFFFGFCKGKMKEIIARYFEGQLDGVVDLRSRLEWRQSS